MPSAIRTLLLLASSALFIACSSSSDSSSSSSSSGSPGTFGSSSGGSSTSSGGSNGSTSSGTSSGASGATSSGGTTVEQCISACEAKYPKGKVKGDAIDACWAAKCTACQNMQSNGTLYGPTSGSCQTDVKTPSATCSTCTAKNCCAAWDACFTDADCTALNSCSVACYK